MINGRIVPKHINSAEYVVKFLKIQHGTNLSQQKYVSPALMFAETNLDQRAYILKPDFNVKICVITLQLTI